MTRARQIDSIDADIDEALVCAIVAGDADATALAVAWGADVHQVFINGRSILMEAVMARRADLCQILLEAGADPVSVDQWGETLLHRAAFSGNPVICEMLVERGADPCFVPGDVERFVRENAECSEELGYLTPLQKAVHGRKPDAIRYLFGVTGADPYQTTLGGKSMDDLVGEHEPALMALRAVRMEWNIRQAIEARPVRQDSNSSGRVRVENPL